MSEEEIIIHVDGYDYWTIDDNTLGVVIICAPTGVLCAAQVGGVACDNIAIEGYPIFLRLVPGDDREEFDSALARFDDCKWGCGIHWGSYNNDKSKLDYGTAIDKFLKESINPGEYPAIYPNLLFSFDYERLDEVMEGWWPVLVQFRIERHCGGVPERYEKKHKGYLHFGNCD